MSENAGQSDDNVLADADRDYWMISDESVEYRIVDEVIKNKDK